MSFSHLFLAVLLVSSTAAFPFTTGQKRNTKPSSSLKTVMKANLTGGITNVIVNDKRRLKALISRNSATASKKHSSTTNVFATSDSASINNNGFLATTNIQVGNPSSTYTLIVDTGSSNTFVGANAPYVPTNSSTDTGEKVAVTYGSGSFSGEEFTDNVVLGAATIIGQSIGVASQSQGFVGTDGILGLGPDDLTQGTLMNQPATTIPTVTDNLAQQGAIQSALVGVSLPLTTSNSGTGTGSLDFGAPDTKQCTGPLNFVPVTTTSPASLFWGIDQSITYGNQKTNILNGNAGIVDTGTTLMYIATDAFNAYVAATGATTDATTGLLTVNVSSTLQSLFFQMGGNTLEFTANAQIFPRSLNTQIGGNSNSTYLIMQDIGTPSGQGLDFVNGFTFLQRFYSVFDTPNKQVGFATTAQTDATSN